MELALGDPWLYLTAFGLVASAGLLVYLVKQLNAASDEDEEGTMEPVEEKPAPAPAPPNKPMTLRPDVKIKEESAADAISMAMGGAPPAPAPAMSAPPRQTSIQPMSPMSSVPPPVQPPPLARSPSELSPAVAFIKALHEDIQTFHWEIQAIKKKLDRFEEAQEKQMTFLIQKLDALESGKAAPAKPGAPDEAPPSPFQ